jgi:hypothetical protein
MPTYTVDELRVGLKDVLENKAALLGTTRNGPLYAETLRKGLAALDSLKTGGPIPAPGGLSMVADRRHDALARFIRKHLESYLLDPDLDLGFRGRVERLLTFAPKLAETNLQQTEEVAAARDRRARLPDYEADLQSMSVASGGTLLEAFGRYLDAAEAIDEAIRTEASADAQQISQAELPALRSTLNGELTNLREAVAGEVKRDMGLPRNLAAELFSYFDEIDRRDEQRPKKKSKKGPAATGGKA